MVKLAKKRSDSFFGLHFDFHPTADIIVGDNLRYDVIAKLLDETKPDYVQVDTKGHPGLSSYPTKVGHPAPLMMGDPLKMWRELTAERGIALYGHHSGLFDMRQAKDHPEWAVVDENGVTSDSYMSVFGEYPEKFLIPQLKELALEYKLDGAWVDGECWGTKPDYSENAQKAWAKVSGTPIPKSDDPDYPKYREFLRDAFKAYVANYIAEIKRAAPDFQITSNWIYSQYMPEKPDVSVDFLSGDYSPNNSVNSARIQGRYLANQGLPWDLMAWGHNSIGSWLTKNRSTKETVQHCQEAAYIISQGGGFQFYNWQYGGGSTVQEWAIPTWAKVAEFVRAREPFCKGAKPLPQVGVFLSSEGNKAEGSGATAYPGTRTKNSANGLIHVALDCGYATELLETHNLDDRDISEYGAIVVAQSTWFDPETKSKLMAYAENGGSLIIASPVSARLFGFGTSDPVDKLIHISDGESVAPMEATVSDLAAISGAKVCGTYYLDNYMGNGPYTAALSYMAGKGKVVVMGIDYGCAYSKNRTTCSKNFFKKIMADVFKKPLVTVEGSSFVELGITRRDNMIYIHLLNYAGPHDVSSIRSYNEIPKLGPLTVKISDAISPKSVTIEPVHKAWKGNPHRIRIESLDVHTIIAIEL
ncbi:MAG: hypothetical protein IJ428_02540 [Clostridia bacterium]|nr:hypothetical protein [Clostridia bacterium]